jgi:citrate synthase
MYIEAMRIEAMQIGVRMSDTSRISAGEAAARLGVKRETLYAYVSRGLIESRTLDGKTSTFDPDAVDAMVRARNRPKTGRIETSIVSALTHVDGQRAFVRGHDLVDLATGGAGFETVASLLWTGELQPVAGWGAQATRAARLGAVQRALPDDAPLLDRLRAAVVVMSAADAMRHDVAPLSVVHTAAPLIAAMVDALPVRHRANDARIAARLWGALTSFRPTPRGINALDGALVLLADHDLAASTFAARVAASTRADPYSVVLAGLGALGGPLHGAASAPVHDLIEAAMAGRGRSAIGDRLASGDRVPGFGHFLYPDGDPRATALLELVRAASPSKRRIDACDEVLDLVRTRTGIQPNIDFGLAALSVCAAMPRDAGEAIFAIARTAGWIAHAIEEYSQAPLRFRPVTRYVGP